MRTGSSLVGVLAEVYRNCALRRICQADIADTYEHKHQILSAEDETAGLLKMCIDIAKSLFRNLSSEGVVLSEAMLKTLWATYLQNAHDAQAPGDRAGRQPWARLTPWIGARNSHRARGLTPRIAA